MARANDGIASGAATSLATLAAGALTWNAIAEAAASGDSFAVGLMSEAGNALARAIAEAGSFRDLDRVVLGGGLLQSGDVLLAPMRREMEERARLPFTRNLDIRLTSSAREAGVVGAAKLCLRYIA